MSHEIIFAEAGTVMQVGKTKAEVVLTDDNCIWGFDNNMYFTKNGWDAYQERKKKLSDDIDNMRNMA